MGSFPPKSIVPAMILQNILSEKYPKTFIFTQNWSNSLSLSLQPLPYSFPEIKYKCVQKWKTKKCYFYTFLYPFFFFYNIQFSPLIIHILWTSEFERKKTLLKMQVNLSTKKYVCDGNEKKMSPIKNLNYLFLVYTFLKIVRCYYFFLFFPFPYFFLFRGNRCAVVFDEARRVKSEILHFQKYKG